LRGGAAITQYFYYCHESNIEPYPKKKKKPRAVLMMFGTKHVHSNTYNARFMELLPKNTTIPREIQKIIFLKL
jgi:hypothetical protein